MVRGSLLSLGNGEKIGGNVTDAVERSARVREVSEGVRGLAVDEREDFTSSVDIAQRGVAWSRARRPAAECCRTISEIIQKQVLIIVPVITA